MRCACLSTARQARGDVWQTHFAVTPLLAHHKPAERCFPPSQPTAPLLLSPAVASCQHIKTYKKLPLGTMKGSGSIFLRKGKARFSQMGYFDLLTLPRPPFCLLPLGFPMPWKGSPSHGSFPSPTHRDCGVAPQAKDGPISGGTCLELRSRSQNLRPLLPTCSDSSGSCG